jgi:subtilase family serine protease
MDRKRVQVQNESAKSYALRFLKLCGIVLTGLAVFAFLPERPSAQSTAGQSIVGNTPGFVSTAYDLGPQNPSQPIVVSLWLKPHNRSSLDARVQELYEKESPNYQRWLTAADVKANFAPTDAEVKTVEAFLQSSKLRFTGVGPDNFFVSAQGTVGQAEQAFRVQIDKFSVNGKTYYANTRDPYIQGPAAQLIGTVYGLSSQKYQHPYLKAAGQLPNQTAAPNVAAAASSTNALFTTNCFTGVKTETYNTNGSFPIATYTGNTYNGTQYAPGCGYTPPEIQTAYNLNGLYAEGYKGQGQTIAIIDWCGSPTIRSDANVFSAKFGLPSLTSSNFHIIDTSLTPPTCAAPDPEINIDVEWAHAIAPGANINLLVPSTADFDDVDAAELYAIVNGSGNVISGSYGSEELYTSTEVLENENLINELAAAMGISANFATGDSGDYTFDFGAPPSVSAPADSPYATAVGGVSLALSSDNRIAWQAGWGNNETLLDDFGSIFDPPANFGFYAGSGGGPSAVFAKPSFQKYLPGDFRQLPDISWLGDPFTGAAIAISYAFQYPPVVWVVYGGTSVSTPMFSALWAIANEEAGKPLGQAAAYLYSLPKGTIRDVVPIGSSSNPTASIQEPYGTNTYSAEQLAGPLENTTTFYSALWKIPLQYDLVYVITFGTDSGLMTTRGWDNVTGLGTPNAKAFADAFKP